MGMFTNCWRERKALPCFNVHDSIKDHDGRSGPGALIAAKSRVIDFKRLAHREDGATRVGTVSG